ncbi:hypothetical protein FK481_0076 [Listeria phage LP-010]|uniref:Uncharacterized protein n=3 Tax=Homburgvirus TaxID=1921125 RepID=A0A6C0QZW3_9CAUD|nr:hypothetical protein FK481_0076 [Listeria phage LP-010]QDK04700.1 hypothetical protein FK482_0078 [Listeria phage LP-013]QHZ59421.1 hypothetical protein FK483_0078 [Listeria phage LP-018]
MCDMCCKDVEKRGTAKLFSLNGFAEIDEDGFLECYTDGNGIEENMETLSYLNIICCPWCGRDLDEYEEEEY